MSDLILCPRISLLSLHRFQLSNLPTFHALTDYTKLIARTPLEVEIGGLVHSLKEYAEFYSSLTNSSKLDNDPSEEGIDATTKRLEELLSRHNNNMKRHRHIFFECGGPQNLIACLKAMSAFINKEDATGVAQGIALKQLGSLLGFFDMLYIGDVKMPIELSHDDELLQTLFPLFSFDEIFDQVLHAFEDLLIGRESVLPLEKIPEFYKIVEALDKRRLSQFANVIALLIFEHNRENFADIFARREQLRIFPSYKQITLNQAIVIKIPDFFPKILSQIEYITDVIIT